MSKIYVTDREENTHELNAETGLTLMEIIRDAGLDIEAACGGCCACATCHLYIDEDWEKKLPKIENEEESMLDQAFHVTSQSRLGCQIEYNDNIDGIKLTLAPE
jgi:2Fe-2S ferredoxin